MKTHFINERLNNNAAMQIPECKAHTKLIDTDSGHWNMTRDINQVTCKNCLKIYNKRYIHLSKFRKI